MARTTRRTAEGVADAVVSLGTMQVDDRPLLLPLSTSDFWELDGLFEPWRAAPVPAPTLVILNESLAGELGLEADALRTPEGVAVLVGNVTPEGASPVAQAYAGHQFGGYSPRLGDGRALLLGEVVDIEGRRRDVHLKGSGPTPFARGGDGRAALGPMLREYVVGETMHALGILTTRALAVVATGQSVRRDTPLPGAVLVRVAASHLRVGTFQYAAARGDATLVPRLADHAIARHHPQLAEADDRYLAFYEAVVDAQASLVAKWMLVGFIHGVMNTDNTTISGETIDYGPCAFMDAYDPATVFSSIDHGGRYAFGNQPGVMQWNLARLAETLLPLFADDPDSAVAAATAVLESFPARYERVWTAGMNKKLGLQDGSPGGVDVVGDLLGLLQAHRVDFTSCFRALAAAARGDEAPVRALFAEPSRSSPPCSIDAWLGRWRNAVSARPLDPGAIASGMDRVNPLYIPRNHQVEAALSAAGEGDLEPFHRLVDVVTSPFEERIGLEAYATPAPASFAPYRTFCGT